jgi:hypothetical protein
VAVLFVDAANILSTVSDMIHAMHTSQDAYNKQEG